MERAQLTESLEYLLELPVAELVDAVRRIDGDGLEDFDLVTLLRAQARVVSHFQAGLYETMAKIGDRLEELGYPGSAPPEIATALRLTRNASETEYGLAVALQRHHKVATALADGLIDLRRARVLIDSGVGLDWRSADRVITAGLAIAPATTPGQLRARLNRLRFELDPDEAEERFKVGIEDRRVVVTENPDGTANFHALNLSPEKAAAIRRRIEETARAARVPGDTRTADQRRADTFVDLLTGPITAGGKPGGVMVVVPAETLAGGDAPGDIPGFGPVLADIARRVAAEAPDGGWEYLVTDNGRPVATGTLSRKATRGMRRVIRAAHPTCVFPGCRMPAEQADIDHTRPWVTTRRTQLEDLAPLCRYHHRHRHRGWSYQPTGDGTGFVWTSPLGRTYTTNGQSP